ncbi:hypothetical protein EDD18DRAFT_1102053 [Armillaria luteobubalina]|uniref:Uncharacterized protein n=1 Tax=Armillaria luteobubalina TaxID=153913 RepID=A0AA39TUP6_9AGAR|nr:hypothetical protein EDD18DRAFT_1102053 [Armillaria luteobubalina]
MCVRLGLVRDDIVLEPEIILGPTGPSAGSVSDSHECDSSTPPLEEAPQTETPSRKGKGEPNRQGAKHFDQQSKLGKLLTRNNDTSLPIVYASRYLKRTPPSGLYSGYSDSVDTRKLELKAAEEGTMPLLKMFFTIFFRFWLMRKCFFTATAFRAMSQLLGLNFKKRYRSCVNAQTCWPWALFFGRLLNDDFQVQHSAQTYSDEYDTEERTVIFNIASPLLFFLLAANMAFLVIPSADDTGADQQLSVTKILIYFSVVINLGSVIIHCSRSFDVKDDIFPGLVLIHVLGDPKVAFARSFRDHYVHFDYTNLL